MALTSIIIPSYRSANALANNLPYLMDFIKEKGWDIEVIVVDDGSNDEGETQRVAENNNCSFLTYQFK